MAFIRYGLFGFCIVLLLASCTFNPLRTDNNLTGSPVTTGIGAAAGVGTAALLGASKPGQLAVGGLIGGAVGYYVSTLRFASGGIIQGGGQVFVLGDYVTIEIPSDNLFDVNSAEFLDCAKPILDSAVAVLKRYPNQNIIISGNTSGFGTRRFEQQISEQRAQEVAAYLWSHGVSEWKFQSLDRRKLTYVGYGNYFPIANNIHNESIRQNSRIQITAYPNADELLVEKCILSSNELDEPSWRKRKARQVYYYGT